MAMMKCPICDSAGDVIEGIQIYCPDCRNWTHVDNWTYTKEEWAKIQDRINKKYS